jgi:type I restriction enzyme S subunit
VTVSNPTLSDLCSLIVDSEHKTAPKDPEGPHPLVRTTDLGRARVDYAAAQRVNADTYINWTRRAEPSTGDLILAREAPVGGIGRVPAGIHPVLGQRTVLLRPGERVDSRFLMYRLAASDLRARMNEMATGATVPHLNMADIRSFVVPDLPAREEQRRISATLAAFDDLIEINERRIELLEDLARSLYRERFVRGHHTPDAADAWDWTDLGSIARWFSGGTPSTKSDEYWDGGIPWITSGCLRSVLLDQSERTLTPAGVAAGSRLVERDAVLFVVRGMSLVREVRAGIAERSLAFGQDCKALVAVDGVEPLFLAFTVLDRQTTMHGMVELAGHGTGKLSTDRLKALPVALPPLALQRQFVEAVTPMRDGISASMATKQALARTRDLLLPRVVTGRLDISTSTWTSSSWTRPQNDTRRLFRAGSR